MEPQRGVGQGSDDEQRHQGDGEARRHEPGQSAHAAGDADHGGRQQEGKELLRVTEQARAGQVVDCPANGRQARRRRGKHDQGDCRQGERGGDDEDPLGISAWETGAAITRMSALRGTVPAVE